MSYAETSSPQVVYAVNAMLLRSTDYDSYSVTVTDDHAVAQIIKATVSAWTSYAVAAMHSQSIKCSLLTVTSDMLYFSGLVSRWRVERGATSSITKMAMCPAYQQIIAMGSSRAIPLILRQMESEDNDPDMWFWALQMLADTDPVTVEDRGDMKRMAETWINWGRQQGYAW